MGNPTPARVRRFSVSGAGGTLELMRKSICCKDLRLGFGSGERSLRAKLFDIKNLSNVGSTDCRATGGLRFGRKSFEPRGLILTLVVMAFTLGARLGFEALR